MDHVFCRAANADLLREELVCENCFLCGNIEEESEEKRCVYLENGREFPDFERSECGLKMGILQDALQYAADAHKGSFRKGVQVPYILHPMEAAWITLRMTGDEELAAAAALHDVIEDTPCTYEDIADRFGKRVADIVLEESENKRPDIPPEQSWMIRKEEGINRIAGASEEAKAVALSDKLSNMRATWRAYQTQGDDLFERFHRKDKSAHAWYHGGLLKALASLADTEYYKEYKELYRRVFGPESPSAEQE